MSIRLTENDFKHHKMTGSPMETDMEGLRKQKAAILNAEDALGLRLIDINNNADTSTKTRAALVIKRDSAYNALQQYLEQERKINYAFITGHPASYLSPYLMAHYLGSRRLPIDSALMLYNAFTPAVKNSIAGAEIGGEIKTRQASAPGKVAPVFVKTDIDGKNIDLTSFRNKNYVLLDFWASWCIPCRAETPRIKQLYKRFHTGGLEIISIAWDFKETDWRDAISKDSTGMWRHIKADMHANDGTMREKYAINGIPSYILIDKNGVIIGRYHGSDDNESTDDLEKKLSELIPAK